ncbi:hypothetical protein [Streptomyces sp. NPDC006527]|uniref:hypothetical protein n=1 Tax=Streptomyces sp. NPDC006527 TaxID=3364749 RepID=UPI00367DC11C
MHGYALVLVNLTPCGHERGVLAEFVLTSVLDCQAATRISCSAAPTGASRFRPEYLLTVRTGPGYPARLRDRPDVQARFTTSGQHPERAVNT